MQPQTPITGYVAYRRMLAAVACLLLVVVPRALRAEEQLSSQVAVVTSDAAAVMDGQTRMTTAARGERLPIAEVRGSWVLVVVEIDGVARRGWMKLDQIELVEAELEQPSPAIAPPPRTLLLRVKVDETPVMTGSATIAILRRGELREVRKEQGEWYAVAVERDVRRTVGWVQKSDVEVVAGELASLSTRGDEPASLTTAGLATDADFASLRIQLQLPANSDDATFELTAPPGVPSGRSVTPTVEIAGRGQAVALAGESWTDWLSPGTRSLWVKEVGRRDGRLHRVDMPACRLGVDLQAYKYPDFDEGIVVHVPVDSLTPGFVVECAIGGAPAESEFFVTPTQRGALPRLADVYRAESGDQLRLIVPYATAGQGDGPLTVRIRDAAGSVSNSVTIQRRGDEIDAHATQLAEGRPLPVDSTVETPDVELLKVATAIASMEAAGLETQVVDEVSLATRSAAASGDRLVLRQGVPPGERALVGQTILLAIAEDDGWRWDNETSDQASEDEARASPPVDVGDDLGFVDPFGAWPVVSMTGTQPIAGGGIDPAPLTDAESSFPGGSEDEEFDATALDELSGLPIDPDPGVSLAPDRDEPRELTAALLRQVLRSLLAQPDWRDLPGVVGNSITAAIRNHESDLRTALASPPTPDVVQPLVDTVFSTLAIDASDAQRNEACQATFDFARRRWRRSWLDRTANGLVADDLAVSVVEWLFEAELWEPGAVISVDVLGDGTLIAAPLPTGQSPDGIATTPPPLVTQGPLLPPELATAIVPLLPSGGPANAAAGGSSPAAPNRPPAANQATLPPGDPVVSFAAAPDEVRVPQIVDESVEVAAQRTGELGILIDDAENLLLTDRVVAANPQPQTWIKAGTSLKIEVERRVPNVVKLSLDDAQTVLVQRKFTARVAADAGSTGIVITQSPQPGVMAAADQPVTLSLAVITPNLVDKLQQEAAELLERVELRWRATTRAFTSDKVVAQSPHPGSLVKHGEAVELTLHVAVPNFVGLSLTRARTSVAEHDLQADVTSEKARDEDVVRGQQPSAGDYIAHGASVTLGPVLGRLPNVVGESVGRAEMILRGEDYESDRIGEILAADTVTGQNPRGGAEFERGRSVTLDARVTVPDVRGRRLDAAAQTIRASGGRLRVEINGRSLQTDVVYSQNPNQGRLVFPRTTISLTPGVRVPNVRGQTPEQAAATLKNVGLGAQVTSSGTNETTNRAQIGSIYVDGQSPEPGLYPRSNVNRVNLGVVQFVAAERTVPQLHGLTVRQALIAIKRADLVPIFEEDGPATAVNESGLAGRALRLALESGIDVYNSPVSFQRPDAGTRVMAGSRVAFGAFFNQGQGDK